jgi:acetyl-CoA synthetase
VDPAAVWAAAREALSGLPGDGLNIAQEAAVRHVEEGNGERVAVRHIAADGVVTEVTYAELEAQSARFAVALARLGVAPGEPVAWIGGRRPELFPVLLGTVRTRAVLCPLFAAFGPEPLATRLRLARVRVAVTTEAVLRRLTAVRDRLPDLHHVIVFDGAANDGDALSFRTVMASASGVYPIPETSADDPALLHFTSGTTGAPKGVIHVHEAVVAHRHTAAEALGLRAGDVFWCTADPGWVTGISYGVIAPLTIGATVLQDSGDFDSQRWVDILEREQVNVWYTSPTALRMMRRLGSELGEGRDFGALRVAASVGEPLDAASVNWGRETLGLPIRDTWWQTETGAIMVANSPVAGVKAGAMGKPLPGVESAVVSRVDDGPLTFLDGDDIKGELAFRANWPSLFRGYLDQPERYAASFRDGWYLSGDLVRRDAEGWLHFVGRGDDLIKCAGHLIGPTEVEQVLLTHPVVADAAVVGLPDEITGERVHAYVVLLDGVKANEATRRALIAHARSRLGPAVAPRSVEFRRNLPHTRSGKILRRVLRAETLGESVGDMSTVEDSNERSEES